MKQLETQISEKVFLNRLVAMCTMQKSFIKAVRMKDIFVLKLDENDFSISFCNKTGVGYLCGKYTVRSDKKVTVTYRLSLSLLVCPKIKKLLTEHLEKICLIGVMI